MQTPAVPDYIRSMLFRIFWVNIVVVILLASSTSCRSKGSEQTQQPSVVSESEMVSQGFSKVVVAFFPDQQAPCDYLLSMDGKYLEPAGLPEEFRVKDMTVWIRYSPSRRMSLCSKGMTVDVVEIKKR